MIYSKLFRCDRIGLDRLEATKKAFDEWVLSCLHTHRNFKVISADHSKHFGEATIFVVFETIDTLSEEQLMTERVGVGPRPRVINKDSKPKIKATKTPYNKHSSAPHQACN